MGKIVRCVSFALAVGALAGRPSSSDWIATDDETTTAKPTGDKEDAKGKGDGTDDKKDAGKKKGSILEEDDKTTTAKPTGDKKDAKGKGDGTGDKKKEDTKGEKTKGSLLEEDDKTTTAKPTGDKKDAKGKGDGTGDKKKE